MKNWTGKFEIEMKGEDLFYYDENRLKDELKEIYELEDIEITNVKQIGDIINK